MKPRVSIIILNWNGWQKTVECLESVYLNSYDNYNIILVDNGSNDNSIKEITKYWNENILTQLNKYHCQSKNNQIRINIIRRQELESKYYLKDTPCNKQLTIIENEINYGFAKGNNIAIKYALDVFKSEYIMTLNNDTIVDKNFLIKLINVAERKDDIGTCQSKILFMTNPKVIDAIGINISLFGAYQEGYRQKDYGQYNNEMEIYGACACAALYKSIMLKQIGLFDEDFFSYYEDVDLAWRARLYSWKAIYVPDSIVYHIGSATGSMIKTYYLVRNRFSCILKNAPVYMIVMGLFILFIKIPIMIKAKENIRNIDKDNSIILHYLNMFKKRIKKNYI